MRQKIFGIVLLAIVFILGTCFWYVKSQAFMTATADVIAEKITETLDAQVDIAAVVVESPTTLVLKNITIQDKMGMPILESEKIAISFSPFAVIRGDSIVKSVRDVTISAPNLNLIQRSQNEWNYMDFIKGDKSSEVDFYGKVRFSEARINIEMDGKKLALNDIAGNFDLANQPSIHFDLRAKENEGNMKVSGLWGGKNKAVSIEADNFDLTNYLAYLPEELAIKVNGGKLTSFKATVTSDEDGHLDVDGEALLLDVGLNVEGTDIDDIDGFILFNESELRIFSRGKISDQPIVLKGTTDLNMVEPMLNLEISSKAFDIAQVMTNFPVKGAVNFTANIQGKINQPLITGKFSANELQYQGYTFKNVASDLRFGDDILFIDSLAVESLDGKAQVQGEINTRTEEYLLQFMGNHINLDYLPAYNQGLAGYMDVDTVVRGQGLETINPGLVQGKAKIYDGVYRRISFVAAEAAFYKKADHLTADYVNIDLPQGKITLAGELDANRLDFIMQGDKIALAQFISEDVAVDMSGTAAFHGKITGSVDNPLVVAEVTAEAGSVFYQPYQDLTGKLAFDFKTLTLQELVLVDGATAHTMHGSVGMEGDHAVDLVIQSSQARAENIVKLLLPGEDLTGNVDNRVVLSGTLKDIEAEGDISFHEGSFRKILLREAHGKYKRKAGRTTIEDFLVSSPNLNVKINGAISETDELNFDILADEIDLAKVRLNFPYQVEGKAKFAGKLQGTIEKPIFSGNLTSDTAWFNGNELRNIDGEVRYENNEFRLDSFGFKQGDGSFDLSARFNLATKQMRGDLIVKNSDVAGLLEILNVKQDWLFGRLNGDIHLEGSAEKPKIRMNGTVTNGFLKKYPLDDVSLDIFIDGRVINIEKFYAQQGAGVLLAKGTADLDGDLAVEVAGKSIHAALLTDLAEMDVDTKGTLDFGAQIFGTAESPQANLSLEIKGGGIGGATFDSLYGMCILNDGIIDVQQILLTKDQYKASAYGIVPLAALRHSGVVDVKDQMNLKISLDQADLSILPFLTKEIEWGVGNTNGNLVVTGSAAQPLINGSITVKDGTLKLKQLANPIQQMVVDIQFLNDKIEVKTFDGMMGAGSYQLRGQAFIGADGFKDYAFTLDLDNLGIANKYFTGPLNGTLSLQEDKGVPKVIGQIDLEHCVVDIPSLPDNDSPLPKVRLDVTVNAGKKVRLYNAMLYDMFIEGHANFAGSTQHPRSSGEFSAIRGTVNYLKTPFQIREATVLFNRVGEFIPTVRLVSDTKLKRAKVYLNVDGAATNLQMKLSSSPEMSQQEILSLLTLRSDYYNKDESGIGKDELNAIVNLGLSASFLSEFENIAKDALGVDEFNVVRDTLSYTENGSSQNREVYNLEIGKYVTDKMMLKYTTGIDHNDYYFGVRYDFNNSISLTGDIDQDNKKRFGIEARFKF